MKVRFLPEAGWETFAPLFPDRGLESFRLAGKTFRSFQKERITRALGESDHLLSLPESVWVAEEDLRRLAEADTGSVLTDDSDEPLAWFGQGDPVTGAPKVAATGSFRLRYAWDLIKVNEEVVGAVEGSVTNGELSDRATVEGNLVLGEGSRVLPGVFIEGNVVIGENCKIGPNCYLRGSTSIGDDCHIGQSVEVKNSVIGSGTAIGHLSYLGDSVVGDGVNFGAGTITSNLRHDGKNHRSTVGGELVDTGRRKFGAVVADGVHTGINTSLYPGRKLWPGTMTLPGQVVSRDVR